jgi:limonene-1,2-epoxide hydrolase
VNIGIATTIGPGEGLAFRDSVTNALPFCTIKVEMLGSAVNGNNVYTERIDHLIGENGEIIKSVPVMGVLEIDGDKIVRWRDYFDTAST